jgi:ABC-2 type transport system ATP-binding protein
MLCSRVIIINKGRIEALDSPQNLRARLGVAGHIVLDARVADPRAAAAGLRRVPGVDSVSVRADGDWTIFTIQSNPGADPREALHAHAVQSSWPVRELSRSAVSLEQVFAEVTHAEES